MVTSFPRRWHVCLAIVLAATLLGLQALSTADTKADSSARSFRGQEIGQSNYGSGAVIGTSQPYTGGHSSFELIRSANYVPGGQSMVQTGWTMQPACGNKTAVFWEYANPAIGYVNSCTTYYPTGDKSYYNEYDGNTGYWSHGYQGYVIHSELASQTSFAQASVVTAYGETDSTSKNVQMGGPTSSQAIYLSNIKYKPGTTTPPSGWNYIKTAGNSYATCGDSPCPYGYNWGFAATVLYTYNWTNP